MQLKDKIAVIYGAGGSIGGAVAKAFAMEGAIVYVCGRTIASLEKVATRIKEKGGKVCMAIVDALDENSVETFMDTVIKTNGRIDISFNAIGLEDVQGIPLFDMTTEEFLTPVMIAMKTQLITAKAAGRHMVKQRSGVILAITATPAGKPYAHVGGFGPACNAIESFTRNLAAEIGPHGVRVICIRSAGSPDSEVFINLTTTGKTPANTPLEDLINDTMLRKLPPMEDIANVAVFMASDKANSMTGMVANVTAGTTFY